MRNQRPPAPDEGRWESSLLGMETEVLLATARNYLGPIKTPYDKRVLITKLAGFLRRPETREAILGLLDGLDARILGTMLVTGPIPETLLRDFFRDELRVFDLGLKISNLQERLLLFRMGGPKESFLAVNPILSPDLAPLVMKSSVILGWTPTQGEEPGAPPPERGPQGSETEREPALAGLSSGEELAGADLVSALFGIIHHFPGSLRKNGALSKRAMARVAELLPSLAARPARLEAVIRGLLACGAFVNDEGGEAGLEADAAAYGLLLSRWKTFLPLRLATALVTSGDIGSATEGALRADLLASFLAAALAGLPRGPSLPLSGLRRWLSISSFRMGLEQDAESIGILVKTLADLGLLDGSMDFGEAPATTGEREGAPRPVLVAEGSHLLRVLPEANSEERWFALLLAGPARFGKVWELELDRDSVRRAFASGVSATEMIRRLEALGAHALPQSLAFSLRSWEEEYRSLRLYHGFVLVCDERKRNLVERNPNLASLVMERLGEGVYMLAARSADEIRQRLSAAGIEAPPEIHSHAAGSETSLSDRRVPALEGDEPPAVFVAPGTGEDARLRFEARGLWLQIGDESGAGSSFDPAARIEALKAELERTTLSTKSLGSAADLAKELVDRVERRLILDVEQLGRAELRIERLEAGGLDYSGKARIVERALRTRGDRLEIHYQLSGSPPVRAILRPVKLEKTEKGLVLEAEDLETGGPLRVPLGAASSVRRLRAALFGDEA